MCECPKSTYRLSNLTKLEPDTAKNGQNVGEVNSGDFVLSGNCVRKSAFNTTTQGAGGIITEVGDQESAQNRQNEPKEKNGFLAELTGNSDTNEQETGQGVDGCLREILEYFKEGQFSTQLEYKSEFDPIFFHVKNPSISANTSTSCRKIIEAEVYLFKEVNKGKKNQNPKKFISPKNSRKHK